MLLKPQRGITYGPVRSRRLGRSLGINVLPGGRKVCNFDCRYCQYGWTDPALSASTQAPEFPALEEILKDEALREPDNSGIWIQVLSPDGTTRGWVLVPTRRAARP